MLNRFSYCLNYISKPKYIVLFHVVANEGINTVSYMLMGENITPTTPSPTKQYNYRIITTPLTTPTNMITQYYN